MRLTQQRSTKKLGWKPSVTFEEGLVKRSTGIFLAIRHGCNMNKRALTRIITNQCIPTGNYADRKTILEGCFSYPRYFFGDKRGYFFEALTAKHFLHKQIEY